MFLNTKQDRKIKQGSKLVSVNRFFQHKNKTGKKNRTPHPPPLLFFFLFFFIPSTCVSQYKTRQEKNHLFLHTVNVCCSMQNKTGIKSLLFFCILSACVSKYKTRQEKIAFLCIPSTLSWQKESSNAKQRNEKTKAWVKIKAYLCILYTANTYIFLNTKHARKIKAWFKAAYPLLHAVNSLSRACEISILLLLIAFK